MYRLYETLRRSEARDVLLNDLLDLALELGRDVALRDLGEEGALGSGQVLTELSLPLGDLVDGDGVELEAVMVLVRRKRDDENLRTRPLTPA